MMRSGKLRLEHLNSLQWVQRRRTTANDRPYLSLFIIATTTKQGSDVAIREVGCIGILLSEMQS